MGQENRSARVLETGRSRRGLRGSLLTMVYNSSSVAMPVDRLTGLRRVDAAVGAGTRDFARELPALRILQDRLGTTELRRRLWHMLPGLLPFVLWVIPHDDPTSLRFQLVTSSLALGAASLMLLKFCKIQRAGERSHDCIAAVAGYVGTVLAMLLLFPAHAELGLTVLAIIAFGDGSATLGGIVFGRRRLPWNSKKTIFGTACFVLVGTPIATMVYWGSLQRIYSVPPASHPSLGVALACSAAATMTAAIIETIPVKMNDNLRVAGSASVAILLAQSLLVGWT